jgi:superkiller protein 3
VARAIATGDLARLRDLAQHLNLVTHSARQADRLAALPAAQGETLSAVELLRRAQKQYPGAFWIHRRLASLALRLDPPRYDEAVAGCTMALALRPGQACVLSQLGVARRLGGDHEGALAAHRRAVETEPSHASHHCRLGAELQELGYLTEALRNCRRAVEISPESPAAHGLLGRVLQAQGELSAAVAEFRRSRQLREGDPAIHYRLGNALLEQGDPAGAVTALLRAAELSPDDPRVHSSLGVAALRAGDPARALAALRTAVARGPGLAPARYNLAVALHRRGDLDGATAALRQAFDLDRQLEEAHSYRDAVLVDEGTFDGAQAVFAKAVARAPNDVDLRCDLGLVLGLRREHGKARAALQAALELDPEHGRVYAQLGALLKRMARWNEALEVLRQALALSPDNADVHADIGYVLAKKGAFRRAEAPLLRALEIHAAARTHLGITYVMLGKLQAGLEELERAIQLAPRRHNPHNILGSILVNHRVGFERATRAFHTAIRLDPGNARYHANLGMVLGLEGDAQRALACHRKAAELDPASPEPLTGIGIILCYTAGDFEAALEQFQAALRLAPRSPVLHRHKGIALRSMGRYEEAAAALRKAVALNPNSAGFHLDLAGLLLTRMDDSAGAVPHLQEAIRLNPRYGLPHRHLGLALRRLGKTREAIAALDRAVELAPDFVVALQDLAWLLATCEERDLRDPERAVELAERAYRLRPGPETCRFLGAALSRSGKHADALATLEYGAASHPQGGGFHLRAWLAIVHARLGHEREARRWYQRAREGFRADTPDRDEWQRLLDEAQALIEGLR